jgi:hypothetical protein
LEGLIDDAPEEGSTAPADGSRRDAASAWTSWQRRRARTVAGGVCPCGGTRGGGRSPTGCSGEGPRLGDWARGRVEEEDGREAAAHPAGGTARRWPVSRGHVEESRERVTSLDGEEQSSGKREIPSSSLLREDKAEGRRTWRRQRRAATGGNLVVGGRRGTGRP